MDPKPRHLIPSGIEPVDALIGGLEAGRLYLVHGEGSSKSLFGIRFLIEGLKRGEHVALVINYSPEDAVRKFARVGYDCLEDVYSGRLVILECAEDNIRQIAKMSELTPVLRELKWLMGETNPDRVVFEPIARLVVGEQGNTEKRAGEFVEWAGTTGATAVLVANGNDGDVTPYFRPLVRESFRLEIREQGDRATRYLVFEKSLSVPDQPIEVDPTRGIFLLDRSLPRARLAAEFAGSRRVAPPNGPGPEKMAQSAAAASTTDFELGAGKLPEFALEMDREPAAAVPIGYATFATQTPSSTPTAPAEGPDSSNPSGTQPREGGSDILTDLFDELIKQDPEENEPRRNVFFYQDADFFSETEHYDPRPGGSGGGNTPKPSFSRQFDQPIARSQDSSLADLEQTEREASAISAAEELLRPPASRVDQSHGARSARAGSKPPSSGEPSPSARANAVYLGARPERMHAQPSDYTVMVIGGEVASGQRVVRSLGDYKVERADDGVTGLAKLISFKPDLVVLDVDLQIIDGFKLLEHIRANLDVPIIALSSSHIRASDRIKAAELGADYFLTKPFAIKELRQKARQLIARYRGIDEWITPTSGGADWDAPPEESRGGSRLAEPGYQSEEESFQQDPSPMRRASDKQAQERRPARNGYGRPGRFGRRKADRPAEPAHESNGSTFVNYSEFVKKVENKVKDAIDGDSWFSIVGCRLPLSDRDSDSGLRRLRDLVPSLVRNCDLVSVNHANDVVVMLTDADSTGARAFINRLQDRVLDEYNVQPIVWVRNFPTLDPKPH